MLAEHDSAVIRPLVAILVAMCAVPTLARAERLPLKSYTTADGLAHNVVNRVVRDSRGFLWFCTSEGLSRFDGYAFTTYTVEHGLPSASVNDLLETRAGEYWIGTGSGIVRFDPRGTPGGSAERLNASAAGAMFTTFTTSGTARVSVATVLREDRAGTLWVGTQGGLFRLRDRGSPTPFEWVDLGIPDRLDARVVSSLIEDAAGALWIGTASGLYRRTPDGAVTRYSVREGLPDDFIQSLLIDRAGRFWVGTRSGGAFRLAFSASDGPLLVTQIYGVASGAPAPWINDIYEDRNGTIWLGAVVGLLRFVEATGGAGGDLQMYASIDEGLNRSTVRSVAEDSSGNLWIGTEHGGVARLWQHGFTTFSASDPATAVADVVDLITRRSGELAFVGARNASTWRLYSFTGRGFDSVPLPVTGSPAWGMHQVVIEDRAGDWWFATRSGVARYVASAALPMRPAARYTRREGLAADVVLRLFEDSRGDMWIATVGEGRGPSGVSRWERSTGRFHHYGEQDGLPSGERFFVTAFAEDRSGNVWIGFSADGEVRRYRRGGFSPLSSPPGSSVGAILDLLVDARGRLWIASRRGGVARIDAPDAHEPVLHAYTTTQGLSSTEATALVDDVFGRLYVATGRGIDRIEPSTDRIRHFGTIDGVPLGQINSAVRDRQGALWFAGTAITRLVPQPDSPAGAPGAIITRIAVGGRSQPVSVLGDVTLPPLEIEPNPGTIEIDFLALGFEAGERLRYSHILEGAEQQWSALTDQRRVTYAGLGAGTYRFLVRAVNADGVASETPASFSVTVLRPVWQRWWFISLVAVAGGVALSAAHRYRVARLVEIEHMRTRIATDLHDDIGANLTTIAVLSEVARQQAGRDAPSDGPLGAIAGVARESVASMADIVWAINPDRDRVTHLIRRMRAHAEELCAARGVAVTFDTPDGAGDDKLGVDLRRDLFLIFKEAVTNAARHAGCARVHIALRREGGILSLEIIDDGSGFDPEVESEGNGLVSMRRRARTLGAHLDIVSARGAGTTVRVRLPVRRSLVRRARTYRLW